MAEMAVVPLKSLETLWIQITGTLCNLKCTHCFISCSPTNDTLGHMARGDVRRHVEAAAALGTREYYMTGGEPFLHAEIVETIGDVLAHGSLTILTNGVLIDDDLASRMRDVADAAGEVLELRVSVDGPDAETNDPIRGQATFGRALEGVGALVRHGFRPIMTMMRSWPKQDDDAVLARFRAALAAVGYEEPRLKLLPQLHMGAEAERSRPYRDSERVTAACLANYDLNNLLCHNTRVVSAAGVHVCPILVGEERSIMAPTLEEASGDFPLYHQACYTCVVNGAICNNETTA